MNRRILLIDDMPEIHEDFRKVLAPQGPSRSALDATKAALFGEEPAPVRDETFELDSAYQGRQGLEKVCEAMREGRPYAMAFVDMRMPPGWDGAETVERLWQVDPCLQIVICTAYSDTSWEQILQRLDVRDRLLILKKPFDNIEVRQLASALTAKWSYAQQSMQQLNTLEEAVQERTRKLTLANEALTTEVDERKRLECQLVQSEKLASIGQLAAGVAHEINTPIGYVLSNFGALERYVDHLFEMIAAHENAEQDLLSAAATRQLDALRDRLQMSELKGDIPDLLRESKAGIARVSTIVQDLRDFSRVDSSQEWQTVDLHEGIESTLNVVASEVRPRADVVKMYGTIPGVECLPSHVNQVVMNLIVNAAQAIGPQRGTITVRTGTEGDTVWIEVADTGCGITETNLSRIFDPFFTTKPVGQGTGLGLSLSYGIVKQHGGQIDVRSDVGKGTTFRVSLPIRRSRHAEGQFAKRTRPHLGIAEN